MPSPESLQLNFASAGTDAIREKPRSWRGFRVENVELETSEAYGFHSQGKSHYLALHDFTLLEGELKIDGLPTQSQTELRDTLTFAPRGCEINGWAKPSIRKNSFTALYFNPDEIRDELDVRYSEADPRPFAYARNSGLESTMAKLRDSANLEVVDDLYAEALCLSAALEILGIPSKRETGRLSDQQVRLLYDFIEANIARPIGLDDLAALAGLSRSHFSRSFKATIGVNPHHFVNSRRMVRARAFLDNSPEMPIETIALSVGFRSASVFRRAFQQAAGISPQRYRQIGS